MGSALGTPGSATVGPTRRGLTAFCRRSKRVSGAQPGTPEPDSVSRAGGSGGRDDGPEAAVSGAAMAVAAARGCPPAGSGDRALAELLLEFSRAQYRAKDGGGAAAAKVRARGLGGRGERGAARRALSSGSVQVERIERRCLELFGRDYRYSVIPNVHGEICAHYPRHIVFLERDAGASRDS